MIPSGPSSRDQILTSSASAALAAEYADQPGLARSTMSEPIRTTRPKWWSFIAGSAAWVSRVGLLTKKVQLVEVVLPGQTLQLGDRLRTGGVRDDREHRSEVGGRPTHQLGDGPLVGHVGRVRGGRSAGPTDVGDHPFGAVDAGAVVDRDRPAVDGEAAGDDRTESAGGTGDECHARPSHRATVVDAGRVCGSVDDGSGEGPLVGRQPGRALVEPHVGVPVLRQERLPRSIVAEPVDRDVAPRVLNEANSSVPA